MDNNPSEKKEKSIRIGESKCITCSFFNKKKPTSFVLSVTSKLSDEIEKITATIMKDESIIDSDKDQNIKNLHMLYPVMDEAGYMPACSYWNKMGTSPEESDAFICFGTIGRFALTCSGYKENIVDIEDMLDFLDL